jgi:predicted nucleotidyltransferase
MWTFSLELKEPTFENYMDLKFFLEEILDNSVDLVIYDAIKPRLKPIIEQEVAPAPSRGHPHTPSSAGGR